LDGGPDPPMGRGNLKKWAPIDLPFGLWTRVGP